LFSRFLFPFILLSTENFVFFFPPTKSASRDESKKMINTKAVDQLPQTFLRKTKVWHTNEITV
jgi:competence transcription factor ComK